MQYYLASGRVVPRKIAGTKRSSDLLRLRGETGRRACVVMRREAARNCIIRSGRSVRGASHQQTLALNPRIPSRGMIGVMAKAAAGSAHQNSRRLLSNKPISKIADK